MGKFYFQHDNVYVVPVIPFRINSAVLVQRAVRELTSGKGELDEEDLIAVSLPPSLRKTMLAEVNQYANNGAAPKVSIFTARVTDRRGMEPREVFPVTPCDGLIEAIRIALETGSCLEFVDREISPAHLAARSCSDDAGWPDDGLALQYGVEYYLNLVSPRVSQPPIRFEPVATWREQEMARRIQELRACFHRVLVVCDIAHVRPLRVLLTSDTIWDADKNEYINQPKNYYLMEPAVNVLLRYLDDFPRTVETYEQARRCGKAADFDKTIALLEAIHRSDSGDFVISPRQYQAFAAYLTNLSRYSRRVSPRADQVFHAMKSCFEADCAERTHLQLLKYGNQIKPDQIARVSPNDEPLVRLEQTVADVDNVFVGRSCSPYPRSYSVTIRRKEKDRKKRSSVYHGWPPQEAFVNKMRQRSYAELSCSETLFKSVRFNGAIESGVEPRRTLQSYWRGTPMIYVKHRSPLALPLNVAREPIVWILDEKEEREFSFNPWIFGGGQHSSRYCIWLRYASRSTEVVYRSDNVVVDYRHMKGFLLFCDAGTPLEVIQSTYGDEFDQRIPRQEDLNTSYGLPNSSMRDVKSAEYLWWERLLITGLHYANAVVICMLPPTCSISNSLQAQAKAQRKVFVRLPNTFMTHKQRRLLSRSFLLSVPGYDQSHVEIKDPAWLKHLIDEYSSLMRPFWPGVANS